MSFASDSEVRTRSVPTAAHLTLMGFTPLGVKQTPGGCVIRFSPAALDALNRFLQAKTDLDLMIERAEGTR